MHVVHTKKLHQPISSLAHLILYEELVHWYQLFDALAVVKKLPSGVCHGEHATSMILLCM